MGVSPDLWNKLKEAISKTIPPPHCNGCDEWHCDHEEGQEVENLNKVLGAVVEVLEKQ